MDSSVRGLEKAKRLAVEKSVTVDFRQADIDQWDWSPETYDNVVAVFIQFSPPEMRQRVFDGIRRTLKPGGILLLHGYTPKQVEYGTGGPPNPENMYTKALLTRSFAEFEILRLEEYEAEIAEGTGHKGHSALIDFIGRKPTEANR